MRASDVLRLRWSDFQNDRLFYAMGKNTKAGSLKIPLKASAILVQYEPDKHSADDFVFPELKRLEQYDDKFIIDRTIAFAVSRIDKILRTSVAPVIGLNKKLTMHIARHTFGNLSGDKIPIQMLQKLYRHSSVTTTIGYQANFIHKEADDALNAVINFNGN
jgi:integrase